MQPHPGRTTDPLLGKMWKTKSARFNAHTRLKAKQSLSTTATSFLAFYLVIVALIPLLYEASLPPGGPKFLSVVSLIISIFLIIITLLESAKNYSGEADGMQKCALEISEIYNQFQALTLEEANSRRPEFSATYSDILKKHQLNHKDVDYIRFELMFHKDMQIGIFSLTLMFIRYVALIIAEYWLYFVLIIGPTVLGYCYRSEIGL
ncbi:MULTISPECIES: SLATT domain-containing protein [Mesorhizobium]|uniref:SMODS and SLOG-associating 2TM effector domain-containing protein n=4 Tax=Mesorhizobium TaxID=68287 RepID=Q8KGJ5_RHILI|nr:MULTISPECIES: SLATT domain-containing protein [Mesorhizobium]MBZ9907545.1 SLATT domain-containing protein [Mesorhizobium sp. BR115XR7A]QGX80779.1 SLATT domain-containing protein [Mesorhizobium japonicum R7A]QJF04925.1 SLATT domain-containing protein [Mesorhizobium japonicum R7A]QJF10993.1 SLATT domain-containing protein [Mesorhizobium japonicum]QJI86867.1 SLATT domain-containing protein [Mesorhizobium japonicum]